MDLILILSVMTRALALSWSVVLLLRLRDWRIAVLTAMFALMVTRQILSAAETSHGCFFCFSLQHLAELPGLIVSVLAYLVVVFLGRMLQEQNEAAEVLQNNEARLKSACQAARMGMCQWDINENTIEWSPELFHALGITPNQFKGTVDGLIELAHEEDRSRVAQHIDAVARGDSQCDLFFRITLPTDDMRHVHMQGQTIPGPDAKPAKMLGAIIDVTERKRIDSAIEYLAQGLSGARTRLFPRYGSLHGRSARHRTCLGGKISTPITPSNADDRGLRPRQGG